MNKNFKAVLFLNCLFLSQISLAETVDINSDYWRCTAFDAENKKWTVISGYELAATNKAFDACKKQSNVPSSCKTSRETCEAFIRGMSTRPMWRCTALDHMAEAWRSNGYRHRDDAALAAKAYCREGSSYPDTCYINMITCRNLNSRE